MEPRNYTKWVELFRVVSCDFVVSVLLLVPILYVLI